MNRGVLWAFFLASLLMIVTITAGKAHDWYDKRCCHENDCAPARVSVLPNGNIVATTKHGTAVFGPNTERLPSRDGQWHACMLPNLSSPTGGKMPMCLYMPAGV